MVIITQLINVRLETHPSSNEKRKANERERMTDLREIHNCMFSWGRNDRAKIDSGMDMSGVLFHLQN